MKLQATSTVVKSDSDSGVGTAPCEDPAADSTDAVALISDQPQSKRNEISLTGLARSQAPGLAETVRGSSNHRRRVSLKLAISSSQAIEHCEVNSYYCKAHQMCLMPCFNTRCGQSCCSLEAAMKVKAPPVKFDMSLHNGAIFFQYKESDHIDIFHSGW